MKRLELALLLYSVMYTVKCTGEVCTNTVEGVYRVESRCTGAHISSALSAGEGCAPRATLLRLPWPNSTQIDQMTPTYVTVQQCDGSCTQYGHSCTPRKTRMRKVPVILSKCGISSGTCDKECSTLEIEEHLDCSCSCSLEQSSCRLDQELRADLCSCQCRDILGKQTCLDAGRIWDDSSCSCGCSEQECAPGTQLQVSTCTCTQDPGLEVVLEQEDRAPRSTEPFPGFEMIVIIILLGIIFILIVIVFSLIMRIQRIQRNYRREKMKKQKDEELSSQGGFTDTRPQVQYNEVQRGEGAQYTEVGTGENCSTPSSGFYSELGQERPEFDHLYTSPDQVRSKKHKIPDAIIGNSVGGGSRGFDSALDSSGDTLGTPGGPYRGVEGSIYGGSSEAPCCAPALAPTVESRYGEYCTLKYEPYTGVQGPVYGRVDTMEYRAPSFQIDEAVRLLQVSTNQ